MKKDGRFSRRRKISNTKSNSKFQEFLDMEMARASVTVDEEPELERMLEKKLNVKHGKLSGPDDGLNSLLDGLFDENSDETANEKMKKVKAHKRKKFERGEQIGKNSSVELNGDHSLEGINEEDKLNCKKKSKRKKLEENALVEKSCKPTSTDSRQCKTVEKEGEFSAVETSTSHPEKYIAPCVRQHSNFEFDEMSQVQRRVRGLLNKLSESNVESITEEIASICRSLPRSTACTIVGNVILASFSGDKEKRAAEFAAFMVGMACLLGIDFSAKLLSPLAQLFEDKYSRKDKDSVLNLASLLCYLCIFGSFSSDFMYDFLYVLSERLTELDVSTMSTILKCCGMKLRSDDPSSMKDFILNIQNRVNKLKSSSDPQVTAMLNSKWMKITLETILDVKNNRTRLREDSVQHNRIKKWLQKLRAEDVLLRGLKWKTLLDPEKRGQWWLSGGLATTEEKVDVAASIDKDTIEAQKFVQLAAAYRMNTDLRRAIFCVIMSAEDYVDAFEKLLRLDLTGKQDREIVRVLVSCCMQEKVFNKYYTVLASKLCSHEKNHKFSLQYCLWDHFKELETMDLNQSMNLARFVAEMVTNFSLSLSILKAVDLDDPGQLSPKRIMHFRILFESILSKSDAVVWNVFTRIAGLPELEMLRSSLVFFIKQYVLSSSTKAESFPAKFKIVKKALENVAGVLM